MTATPTAFDSTGAQSLERAERVGPYYADAIGDTTSLNAGNVNPNLMQYMDARRSYKAPVRLASTAALAANTYANGTSGVGATLTANANGALLVDGAAVAVADRVLVKDEATGSHNGIYTVTAPLGDASHPYILTRAIDANVAVELVPGTRTIALAGTVNAGSQFYMSNTTAPTIGTTALTFSTFPAVSAGPSIQHGSASSSGGGSGTVTFTTAYATAPHVVATVKDPSTNVGVTINSISTTGFSFETWANGGASTGDTISWIAAG